ncbi:MAG TPA: mannose-1-phosphate guanylyltransferase [Ignavibacteriaceae bacterium]|nr:mannose-1-phosphate guanylyltransferase [Ignavibacteriaceae bacterium]
MNLYAVIMAGGIGARFWPRSKVKSPKQLLNIFGKKTMIQETVSRLDGIVEQKNIYVITNKVQRDEIIKQLPYLPVENIIDEPFGRNTAACIGLASIIIKSRIENAVTIILPADHIIKDTGEFHTTVRQAAEFADKSGGLVTIGIKPSRPETGYGYIQIEENEVTDNVHKVYTFAEKPNYATAVRFLESGDFYWNSGMFIWRVDTILNEIEKYMPDLFEGLNEVIPFLHSPEFNQKLANVYGKLRNISIDYGIMEKSRNVYLTKGEFSWSDVGSWEEVYQLSDKDENGNAIVGNVFTEMTVDSYIYSPEKFVSVIGVDNLIIINSEDALLVCRRDQSQEVKKIVDHLKINKLTEYL